MCHARRPRRPPVKYRRLRSFVEYLPAVVQACYCPSSLLQSIGSYGTSPSVSTLFVLMGPVETLQAWNQLARIDVNQRAAELGLSHLIHI